MKCAITAPYGPDCPLHNEVTFSPDDSLVLDVSVPIDDPNKMHTGFISDGTNMLVINATFNQLSHVWGQLGKALEEIKELG